MDFLILFDRPSPMLQDMVMQAGRHLRTRANFLRVRANQAIKPLQEPYWPSHGALRCERLRQRMRQEQGSQKVPGHVFLRNDALILRIRTIQRRKRSFKAVLPHRRSLRAACAARPW